MKAKLSLTLDEGLVGFVDAQPGMTRSEKLELIVRRYRDVWRDLELRRRLASETAKEAEHGEDDAWRQAMEEAQWNESGVATSGRSPSRRSKSRGRP